MKKYIKDGIIKPCNQIVIKGQRTIKDKDGNDKVVNTNIYNPKHEDLIANGWEEYITPIYERTIEDYRRDKIHEINNYDSSSEVNNCYIKTLNGEVSYWANKTERSALKSAVQDCIVIGRDVYRLDLRDIGVSVDINCNKLLEMLSALEVYAIDCYNKTTDHIFNVNSLTTIEEIENYDYRSGYPEKLVFDIWQQDK